MGRALRTPRTRLRSLCTRVLQLRTVSSSRLVTCRTSMHACNICEDHHHAEEVPLHGHTAHVSQVMWAMQSGPEHGARLLNEPLEGRQCLPLCSQRLRL